MALPAIPAGNQGSRRGAPLIGTVARKPATPSRVQRTARQTCIAPGLLANVFLAGEITFQAKLHRPPARTAATVAGLSLSRRPAILHQMPIRCLPVKSLGNQSAIPGLFTPPDSPAHR
jgi:hypothetical protein